MLPLWGQQQLAFEGQKQRVFEVCFKLSTEELRGCSHNRAAWQYFRGLRKVCHEIKNEIKEPLPSSQR